MVGWLDLVDASFKLLQWLTISETQQPLSARLLSQWP